MSQCRRQNSNKCHCQAQRSQEKTWDMQWQAILGLGFCITKQIPANPGSICARPNGTSTACIVENFGVKASRFQDCWRKRIEPTNPTRSTVCPVCVPYMAGCQPVGIIAFGQLFWTEPCMHTWHPQLWHKEAGQKDWQPPGHCISAPNVCMVDSSNLNEPSELQHFMLSSLLIQMPWCQLIELWSHHNVSATLAFEPNHFLYNFCLGPLQKPMSCFPAAANSPMIGCMASFKALHLWFCITWVLFPVTRLCAHLHTQSKKQKPKCCFHIRHVEHAAKEDCSKCSFQFLSALQSFESSILFFSFCQLFKALNPASCFSVVVSYSKLCNQHLAFKKQKFRKSAIVWLWIFTAKSIFTHTRMSFCMYQKHTKTN